MMTVHDVAQKAGVSVRTLHHYDSIGLLPPSAVTEAGYRLYDDSALKRLHTILLFRELQFPLSEIKKILDEPGFDAEKALSDQIKLLEMRRDRLTYIIGNAREILRSGDEIMSFSPFNEDDIKSYEEEAKKRWGKTDAYRQYESRQNTADAADGLMELFAQFGAIKESSPESAEAQELARLLQKYITANFYECTDDIFASLGKMYTEDERMKKNIDKKGGAGTAEFASRAIEIFCDKLI